MEAGRTQEDSSSREFPNAVIAHTLKMMPANERALSGRLVFREARDCLSGPEDCTASLTQPLPAHAAQWAQVAGQQHVRQLAFDAKPQMLCAAAASGCDVNVEAAWGALQPSFFTQEMDSSGAQRSTLLHCPGVAAVRAGHPQLLNWLVRTCPALLDPCSCAIEAGRHCDLAGLKMVHQAVGSMITDSYWCGGVLEAAAESATPDAVAKLEWLDWLTMHSDQQLIITHQTALAAVRSGDFGRLRWLRVQGCLGLLEGNGWSILADSPEFLAAALQHANLTTVQWLIDNAGCSLPDRYEPHLECLEAAIKAPDSVAKVQWLQQRGVGITLTEELVKGVVDAAVKADNLEMLVHLQSLCGPEGSQGHVLLQQAMAVTRACPVSVAMAQQLQAAGYKLGPDLCYRAAQHGQVALLRWLVHEAGVSPAGKGSLRYLIENWRSAPRVLLEVVQLLLDAGHQNWDAKAAVHAAALRGDLALTSYLLRLQPRYHQGTRLIAAAARGGCEALLEQLVEQQQQRQGDEAWGQWIYAGAAARGDRATLTALRRLGVPWGAGDVVVQAVRLGAELPALQWLVEEGAPVGERRDMRRAVASRTKALPDCVLDWLEMLRLPDQQLTSRPTPAIPNALTRASGTASDGVESAADCTPQQQQVQQQMQPAPCDGVGGAGSSATAGPGTGKVGRGGVEEERPAPGAEQERTACPEGVAACGGADGSALDGEGANGGAASALCAIDDPDWYANTPVNHLLDSIMAHQEGIKAAAEVKIAALQGQVERERERAERERERAEAAEEGQAVLQQQLRQERERAEADRSALQQQLARERAQAAECIAALQEQLRQLQGAGGSAEQRAELLGQGAEGGRQRLRRRQQQQ